MTVDELLDRMTAAEFVEWNAHLSLTEEEIEWAQTEAEIQARARGQ